MRNATWWRFNQHAQPRQMEGPMPEKAHVQILSRLLKLLKICWHLPCWLFLHENVSLVFPFFSRQEKKHRAHVFNAVPNIGGGRGDRERGWTFMHMFEAFLFMEKKSMGWKCFHIRSDADTCFSGVVPTWLGSINAHVLVSRKFVFWRTHNLWPTRPNFSRFWTTWEIAMESVHMPYLHWALQMAGDINYALGATHQIPRVGWSVPPPLCMWFHFLCKPHTCPSQHWSQSHYHSPPAKE